MHAVGHIIACLQDAKTGHMSAPILRKKNLILFEGADIMAGLLAGRNGFAVSHMYFQYRNTADTFVVDNPITRGSGRTSFDAIVGDDPPEDWLRVPIITTPQLTKIPDDSADYDANAAWFCATSAASATLVGESPTHNAFTSSGPTPSKVFSVALVAAPAAADSKQDRVLSRVNLDDPVELPPGKHIVFFWMIKFQ